MFEIGYETRGGFRPNPSQEFIYVLGLKKDLEGFMREFAPLCLDKFDSAILYNTAPSEHTRKELEDFFSEISLVVALISKDFLTTDNNERTSELAYALNKGIQILPVMIEDGLEAMFNEMVAPLHTISKFRKDDSTYEEALYNGLLNSLLGAEVKEEIKEAFSGRVFLSYRKKDRGYAKKLIEIIRSNDDFLDFALWFDDYLVPGKNFDVAILNEIEKSDIFALTVTDNLFNEDNYVIQHEYPEAKRLSKTVFPVDFNTSDEYKNQIPDAIESVRKRDITLKLGEIISKLTLKEQTPQHKYLIGLAYLSGIEVEKNTALALRLLEESASEKYLPAQKELVKIYRYGKGVKVDKKKALRKQSIVLDNFEEEQKISSENIEEYLIEVLNFHFIAKEGGDSFSSVNLLKSVADKFMSLSKTGSENAKSLINKIIYEIGFSLVRLKPIEAEDYLEKALKGCKNEKNVLGIRKEAIIYSNLGYIYLKKGESKKAERYMLKAFEKFSSLIKLAPGVESLRDFGGICCYLSELYNKLKLNKAKKYIELFEKTFNDLYEITRDLEDLYNLGISYEKHGDYYKNKNDLKLGIKYYAGAKRVYSELLDKNDDYRYRKALATVLRRGSELLDANDETEGAYGGYKQCYDLLLVEANRNKLNIDNLFNFALAAESLADILVKINNLDDVKTLYNSALDIYGGVKEEVMLTERMTTSSRVLEKLANISEGEERKEYLTSAVMLYEAICSAPTVGFEYKKELNRLKKLLSES